MWRRISMVAKLSFLKVTAISIVERWKKSESPKFCSWVQSCTGIVSLAAILSIVTQRSSCGEERCVTILKTAARETSTGKLLTFFFPAVLTWKRNVMTSPRYSVFCYYQGKTRRILFVVVKWRHRANGLWIKVATKKIELKGRLQHRGSIDVL